MKVSIEIDTEGKGLEAVKIADAIRTALLQLMKNPKTLDALADAVCFYGGISKEELKGESRNKDVINARFLFIHIADLMGYDSLKGIGRYLNRAHNTIMSARDKVNNYLDMKDAIMTDYVNNFKRYLE
jgi:chromosomal replication initiation ATPase DnaA